MVKRAYKFRFYPTKEQEQLLAKTFGCTRFVYNYILNWRSNLYQNLGEKVSYSQASAKLTEIKRQAEYDWLNDVSCVPLQQCLRHQQTAFNNFFDSRCRHPKFKKKFHRQSIELTKSAFSYRNGSIYIAKSKDALNIRWSRDLPSDPSTVTISKDPSGRYFVSCLCSFEPERLDVTTSMLGIDLGISQFLTTDSGRKFDNPRHTHRFEGKLARAQRRLSRKKFGSNNWVKEKIKVSRIHAKISDCRSDSLHKLSRKLINENQVVCVESLAIKNMIRNANLSKHLADAGWGEFVRQLEYKGGWAGRSVVRINTFFPSSKRCSGCGYTHKSLPLDIREWTCPDCGNLHDRDINAAKNIRAAGLAVLALGENVSRV